jgi:hypothetical protein
MKELIRNAGKWEEDTSTFPAFLLSLLVLPWGVMLLPIDASDNLLAKEESFGICAVSHSRRGRNTQAKMPLGPMEDSTILRFVHRSRITSRAERIGSGARSV